MARKRRPLLGESTRRFFSAAREQAGMSFFDRLHGYVYARWPYLYIAIGTGEHPLARFFAPLVRRISEWLPAPDSADTSRPGFADTYHGKVVPPEAARQLVTIEQDINLPDLEKVIPYKRARDIVMQDPSHIVVFDCPCRVSRANPCHPLDVCLVVGEPFASLVMEHHPQQARWISSEEAEVILQDEHERGHVAHAFFKDVMLGRFYAICNCCACCCGAMQAHHNGTPMLASSGFVAQVQADRCLGCGRCVEMCQFSALTLQDDGPVIVEWSLCMGCGVCETQCPEKAIVLVRDAAKGEPLEIQRLIAEVTQCA